MTPTSRAQRQASESEKADNRKKAKAAFLAKVSEPCPPRPMPQQPRTQLQPAERAAECAAAASATRANRAAAVALATAEALAAAKHAAADTQSDAAQSKADTTLPKTANNLVTFFLDTLEDWIRIQTRNNQMSTVPAAKKMKTSGGPPLYSSVDLSKLTICAKPVGSEIRHATVTYGGSNRFIFRLSDATSSFRVPFGVDDGSR